MSDNVRKIISHISDIREVALYLHRIGARPRSFKDAVVEVKTGKYFKEKSVIRFSDDGEITVTDNQYLPTDAEKENIKKAFEQYEFPKHICVDALVDLPEELKNAKPEDVYIFYNDRGQIEMLQQRVESLEGKDYWPWTMWSDGQWRKQEHGGLLPLWGMEQLKEHSIVFIHEGAKPAKAIFDKIKNAKLCTTFPWIEELKHAAHLGWIGGASNPHRTNWEILKKHNIKRVYIVADNDAEGRHAVPKISKKLTCPTFVIQFDQSFKDGFDLADPFPDEYYDNPEKAYTGPSFQSLIHPATWATDSISIPSPSGRGRPSIQHKLRSHFAEQWRWIEQVERFICVEFPFIILKRDQFNIRMTAFSDSKDTAALLNGYYTGENINLTYRPDKPLRFITDEETSALNVYRPPTIKPNNTGSADFFLKFLEYLIPDEEERRQVMRWMATLIARPTVKIMYGLIMMSEVQGIGKSLLGDYILAPLMGKYNCSWPNENMIVGQQFNGWLSNKRLVLVNEIYSGHNWLAYNKLKQIITDPQIDVNIKHMATYTIDNWAHFYVCSNSMIPLRIDDKDRRWYVPRLTDKAWELEQFTAFHNWLRSGGLEKILGWAYNFGDYIKAGAEAPMSIPKKQLIEESRTEAEKLIYQLGRYIADQKLERNISFTISHVHNWLINKVKGTVWETPQRIGNILKSIPGVYIAEEQIKFKGRNHRFVTNNKQLLEPTPERGYKLAEAFIDPAELLIGGDEF